MCYELFGKINIPDAGVKSPARVARAKCDRARKSNQSPSIFGDEASFSLN